MICQQVNFPQLDVLRATVLSLPRSIVLDFNVHHAVKSLSGVANLVEDSQIDTSALIVVLRGHRSFGVEYNGKSNHNFEDYA